MMVKEYECPNCGPGHKLVGKENGQGVCATCGGTFTPGPEPRLVAVGEFDAMKGRVEKVEKENAELRELLKQRPAPDVPPAPKVTPDDPPEEDEEDDL